MSKIFLFFKENSAKQQFQHYHTQQSQYPHQRHTIAKNSAQAQPPAYSSAKS
jgi:hypothetical protein